MHFKCIVLRSRRAQLRHGRPEYSA